jgi:hypothetical protein
VDHRRLGSLTNPIPPNKLFDENALIHRRRMFS